jgi:hypothetical protein
MGVGKGREQDSHLHPTSVFLKKLKFRKIRK